MNKVSDSYIRLKNVYFFLAFLYKVSIDDERYKSGKYIFYRVGTKHKEETILKIQKNGLKGRKGYTNGINQKYFYDHEEIPVGYYPGMREDLKEKTKLRMMGLGYAFNPDTMKHIRISEIDTLPEGYIRGRLKSTVAPGLSKMNSPLTRNMFNLKMGKREYVKRGEEKFYHTITPDNGCVVICDNYVFESCKTFNIVTGENIPALSVKNQKEKFRFSHLTRERFKNFLSKMKGMCYNDLDVYVIPINDYVYSENHFIIRSDTSEFDRDEFRRIIEEKGRIKKSCS